MTKRKTRLERKERAKTARKTRLIGLRASQDRLKAFYAADTRKQMADLREYEAIGARAWKRLREATR